MMSQSLDCCVVIFFAFSYSFCLKAFLVRVIVVTPTCFNFLFACNIILHPITLSLYVSLLAK
jgi:hypothetical protein